MIENISTWYSALSPLQQVFWICALAGSSVFLIQLVLTVIGMDSSDIEVDFDGPDTMDLGGGMSLFTFRALINFLVGFGWSGITFFPIIGNSYLLIALSVVIGVIFALIILYLYNKVKKLEYNAAFNINETVGTTASVYLRIPANGQGTGKVQVSVRGAVHELKACSEGDMIPTGTMVRIVRIINNNILLVEKLV